MASEQYFPEFDQKLPPYPEAALPAVTFREILTLHFNGDEVQILHIPNAHSDAD
jgi:cyclase